MTRAWRHQATVAGRSVSKPGWVTGEAEPGKGGPGSGDGSGLSSSNRAMRKVAERLAVASQLGGASFKPSSSSDEIPPERSRRHTGKPLKLPKGEHDERFLTFSHVLHRFSVARREPPKVVFHGEIPGRSLPPRMSVQNGESDKHLRHGFGSRVLPSYSANRFQKVRGATSERALAVAGCTWGNLSTMRSP